MKTKNEMYFEWFLKAAEVLAFIGFSIAIISVTFSSSQTPLLIETIKATGNASFYIDFLELNKNSILSINATIGISAFIILISAIYFVRKQHN